MNIGFTEILLLLVLFLVLFGAKKLPEVARSLGKSVHEFKKGLKDAGDELDISHQSKMDDQTKKDEKKPV